MILSAAALYKQYSRMTDVNNSGFSSLTTTSLAVLLAFCAAVCQGAESDSVNVTIGIKEWVTDWTTWRINNVFFDTGRIQITEPLNSATRVTSTPQISMRYGNFIASASYLVTETYPLSGAIDRSQLRAVRLT